MSKLFFLGTCRVHEPAFRLRELGLKATVVPARFYTPYQILQMVRFLNGDNIYSVANIHLVSDYCLENLIEGNAKPIDLVNELSAKRMLWNESDTVYIELSSRNESFIEKKDGSIFFVNTYTKKLLQENFHELLNVYEKFPLNNINPLSIKNVTLYKGEVAKVIGKINNLAKKRIVLIPHLRPLHAPNDLVHLVEKRKEMAAWLHDIASFLNIGFYDPISAISKLGDESFFKNQGKDINHMTVEGSELVARQLLSINF